MHTLHYKIIVFNFFIQIELIKMKLFVIVLAILLNFGISSCNNENSRPEVQTPLGTVRGTYLKSVQGRTYAAFEGIPYAKPPVKKYRFREPRPTGKWTGVVDARYAHTCIQYAHYLHDVIGEEDCLYVNIYTPSYDSMKLLDVVIFIHGGAFMFGSGHIYQQDLIMDRDIVYVTLNYRLGPFGFLSTEDTLVPGNMGMKDQVLALKWIKNNIIYFGGNPESITLSGMSAGGASVHLHYMSPLSKGLFHRGFSQSGVALNPWVLQENALDKAKKLAAFLDCDTTNKQQMINCLTYIPAINVTEAVKKMFGFLYNPVSPFGVVVEASNVPGAFLPAHPYEMLLRKQVQDLPWITSVVESEGLYPGSEFYAKDEYLEAIEERWTELAPHILEFNYTNPDSDHAALTAKVKQHYLQGKPVNRETYMDLIKMISDRLFVSDSHIAAKLHAHATKSPVYYYYFTYRGAHSKSEKLSKSFKNFGASHGDDTIYVLQSNVDVSTTETDKQMTQASLDLWQSFASTGVPKYLDVEWKPVSKNIKDPLNYIEIKSPTEAVPQSKDFDTDFWYNLPLKENHRLFVNKKDEL